MKRNHLFGMQVELIRQMQLSEGMEPCYDTPAAEHCNNHECCWRYDCYCEGNEKGAAQNIGADRCCRERE